ncbi:hypothetical protein D9M71_357960 [compost metagenome]
MALGSGIQFAKQMDGQFALGALLDDPRHQQTQQPTLTPGLRLGPVCQPAQRRLHAVAVGLNQRLAFQ